MAAAAIPAATCFVEGCSTAAKVAGLCTKHYQRRRKHGDLSAGETVEHPCVICGAIFVGRVTTKYCSVLCRDRARGVRPIAEILAAAASRTECRCGHCGKAYFPKRKGRNRFCSRECSFASKRQAALSRKRERSVAPARHCVDCSTTIKAPALRCRPCANKRLKAAYLASRPKRQCPDCGAALEQGTHQRRCEPCRQKRREAQIKAGRRTSPSRRAAKALRKAAERGLVAGAERFDPIEILERDKWRCHICGRKAPKSLRGTYRDLAPEIDHIIPLAAGGQHTRANTACACRRCNLAKGAQVKGQLRLFG